MDIKKVWDGNCVMNTPGYVSEWIKLWQNTIGEVEESPLIIKVEDEDGSLIEYVIDDRI